MTSSTAFVTGGSGFIGGRLIDRLVRDGTAVRALARSDASAQLVTDRGAEPVAGDLSDRESLERAAAGADVAYHLAAHLGEWGPWEDFERGNVEGNRKRVERGGRGGRRAGSSTAGPRRR